MKAQWLSWQQKIDALNQRERILLFLVVLVVFYSLLQWLLLDPVLDERRVLQRQLTQLNSQIIQLSGDQQVLQAQLASDVNRDKKQQRDRLASDLSALDRKIENSVVAMIPPQKMAQVLESVLTQDQSMKLLAVENRPVKPVIELDEKDRQQQHGAGLYQHSFVITLQGSYLSTIDYFNKLAALPWRFYWDNLTYEVDQYPSATITLEVHTVSLSEEWIGV